MTTTFPGKNGAPYVPQAAPPGTTLPGRSAGAFQLASRGATQGAIADAVGLTRFAVLKWLAGTSKPSATVRLKLHELYGIAPHLWDEAYDPAKHGRHSAPVAASAPPSPAPETGTVPMEAGTLVPVAPAPLRPPQAIAPGTFGIADAIENGLRRLILEAESDQMATNMEAAAVLVRCADGLEKLSKIRGHLDLSTKLLKVPAYKNFLAALGRGLRGFPEAASRVAKELRAVEAQHLGFGDSIEDIPTGSDFFEREE